VDSAANDLNHGSQIALGFECPLFVPVRDDPEKLSQARDGEGNRPWSAGAGCGALCVGLTQVIWILDNLRQSLVVETPAFLSWSAFRAAKRGLFLWEAFVSGKAKGRDDLDDAEKAIRCFPGFYPDPTVANAIHENRVYSLIGAALLRTGWSEDLTLLSKPCLVIKA
jgi:hypothetical protein